MSNLFLKFKFKNFMYFLDLCLFHISWNKKNFLTYKTVLSNVRFWVLAFLIKSKIIFNFVLNTIDKVIFIINKLLNFFQQKRANIINFKYLRKEIISNIYSSFSTKILISGTVSLILYSLICIFVIAVFSMEGFSPFKFIINYNLFKPISFLLQFFLLKLNTFLFEQVYFENINPIEFKNTFDLSWVFESEKSYIPINYCFDKPILMSNSNWYENFNYIINNITNINKRELVQLNTHLFISSLNKEIFIVILLLALLNLLHIYIAFYSLGYDYLFKKLALKNIIVLFFISSTTLYISLYEFLFLLETW